MNEGTSVDTLYQKSSEGVLGRSLVSTLPDLVSTHCPSLTQKGTSVDTLSQNSLEGVMGRSLVSTLPDLVSTHCPSLTQKVFGS
ncbi:hypothetical protein Taro_000170 [Colocasia esculenta]|uniref:Uncharacterized protein n=1 Tax=Colocasia esculenta TaxID=4460 RepID=A0A843TEC8_COLES|nr:hypothetical protein [Colocasia esculenta]